jgi:hypothetical protein
MKHTGQQIDADELVANLYRYRDKLQAAGRAVEARAVEACIRATRAAARAKAAGEGLTRTEARSTLRETLTRSVEQQLGRST